MGIHIFPQALDGFRQQTDIPSCMRDSAKGQTVLGLFSCEITPAVLPSRETSQAK